MRLIQNKAYLTIQEAVESGIATENYLWMAKSGGVKCWNMIDDPEDKRKVLVGYDALNDDRKRKVIERYGNPYEVMARQPICDMVVPDYKAYDFYRGHRYGAGKPLDPLVIAQYARGASWLNMLNRVQEDKSIVRKSGISFKMFDKHVTAIIVSERKNGESGLAVAEVLAGIFPSTPQRLKQLARKYKEEGYESLISPLYGNKNAAKIGRSSFREAQGDSPNEAVLEVADANKVGYLPSKERIGGGIAQNKAQYSAELKEIQMAVIRRVCAMPNNFDAGQVTEMVNLVFSANGWETLSRATFHDIITKNKHLLTPGRQGKRKYMSDIAMQNKRKAPDYPLYYWTLDGWTVEMMYQEKGEYKRLVMVVVLDAFNKYPVGYAIGERETPELIRAACRNGIMHMQELHGEPMRPLQLQSDNYQIKNLTPFYQAVSSLYFTPAAVGNSKGKVIEPYFKHLNKKHAQKTKFWTGFNVDASKKNQVNREYLDKIKKDAPDKAGLIRQIEGIIAKERKGKIEGFMTGYASVPMAEKDMCLMNELDWLMVFGVELGKRTNKITGQGIIKAINGVDHTYDSFDPAFRANMHLDWMLYGEPDHLMKVLAVSPDRKMKFVLEEKRVLPMDLHSTTQDDVDYRIRVKNFNQERMAEITDQYGSDADIAREVVLNTPLNLNDEDEMALKLMLTVGGEQKERLQNAKGLAKGRKMLEAAIVKEERIEANSWQEKRMQHITQDIDLDQYAQ